mmetsp:Transcript_16948/g.43281  ORF Transcript_16948/g.43281 Transcript_16948/m.43281 type:complete len:236 (-) Transcript_16948:715-1422(-)
MESEKLRRCRDPRRGEAEGVAATPSDAPSDTPSNAPPACSLSSSGMPDSDLLRRCARFVNNCWLKFSFSGLALAGGSCTASGFLTGVVGSDGVSTNVGAELGRVSARVVCARSGRVAVSRASASSLSPPEFARACTSSLSPPAFSGASAAAAALSPTATSVALEVLWWCRFLWWWWCVLVLSRFCDLVCGASRSSLRLSAYADADRWRVAAFSPFSRRGLLSASAATSPRTSATR